MRRSRYYAGADGRCFFYASDATVACPNQIGDDLRREEWEAKRTLLVETLASVGVDAFKTMARAHRSLHGIENADRPDHCAGCGAKLVRLGYGTWIEAPLDQVETNEATRRMATVFGTTHQRVPDSYRVWPKKSEAIAWAREEAQIDRDAAVEVAR